MQMFLDDDHPDGPAPGTVVRSLRRALGSLGLLAGLAAPLAAQLGPPTMVNVAYGPYADPTTAHSDELLDLYAHSDAVGLQPVLIEIHPGGFTAGSKSDFTSYL